MMESLVINRAETEIKNQQQRKMLKNHVLELLLQNNYSSDILSCLDEVNITFPAAYYQVISFSFAEESHVTDDILTMLAEEIEQLTDEDKEEYVYACYNYKEKLIHVLCNYDSLEGKGVLNDIVIAIAESLSYTPIVGIGDAYNMLSGLSASWMESLDEIHKQCMKIDECSNFIYDAEYLQQIINAMEIGSEKSALEKLNHFVDQLKETNHSFLMQQYIFTDFMGEVTKLSRKYHIDLSVHSVSLMLSSKSIQGFLNAASELIHDFCEKYTQTKCAREEDELYAIYEYINTHFADYDISLESVAESFHVSTTMVRQAVLKYTDKTYKEYIIFARIEYAKKLLRKQDLTISDVCQKVGYGNISHFIRLFREIVGITPAKYKQNITNEL